MLTTAVAMRRFCRCKRLQTGLRVALPQVTTTSSRQGKFEARFFHKIFAEEIATVRGHFGPINAVAFSPDGRGFTTGGEDGYVRLQHFDSDYFTSLLL